MDNTEFTCIKVHNSVRDEYRRLVSLISKYTGSGIYYPMLAMRLKQLCDELEKEILGGAHTHTGKITPSPLYLVFINEFDKLYSFNTWDDYGKENIKIPLSIFKQLIIKVFKKTHKNTINMKKEELFNILDLKQVQIGKDWFIVHKNFNC